MSRERLADAYDALAEAYAQVALELRGPIDSPVARTGDAAGEGAQAARPSSPAAPVASVAGSPPLAAEVINITECPKHHVAWADGTYGPYCKQTTDDPAWGKAKGDRMWCRLTPKNAPDYLRMQAA